MQDVANKKQAVDKIASHLSAVVVEALDFVQSSDNRIGNAVESINRARSKVLLILKGLHPQDKNVKPLYEACELIEGGIETLTGVRP